jgi:hypothetical protein
MAQKIRVVTSYGGWFDMDRMPEFNLFQFATSLRATGFLLNETVYVPQEHVVSVFLFDSDTPPQMPPSTSPMGSGTLQ